MSDALNSKNNFSSRSQKMYSFTIHLHFYASFIVCYDIRSSSLYSICSTLVLNNVVGFKLYMNGHVFPKDFHVSHKAVMRDDFIIPIRDLMAVQLLGILCETIKL